MKIALTVLGTDRPGIVCLVSSLLAENNCNIEAISQTVLYNEFAGIFLVTLPKELNPDHLKKVLDDVLKKENLVFYLKEIKDLKGSFKEKTQDIEPFVIISVGKDRVGLIASLSCVMKDFGINITNLRFVSSLPSYPDKTATIYEVEIPKDIDLNLFVSELQKKASSVGLEVSVQHKKVFEDICRI